ncbi:hypothetical protein [Bradyrhizobium japonicum]|uniref:hypothetical protein n=1 Tax=Bradyrhizobium japonicum TaxID=375 RepID=UPI003B670EAB
MMKMSPIDFKPELVINDETRAGEDFGLYRQCVGQARHTSDHGKLHSVAIEEDLCPAG